MIGPWDSFVFNQAANQEKTSERLTSSHKSRRDAREPLVSVDSLSNT